MTALSWAPESKHRHPTLDDNPGRARLERRRFWAARPTTCDVAIIGGGIQGACVYHHLARAGYRVLLVDRGDFGGGTSQASAGLIWGGLLYLRQGDLLEIRRLCTARERLLNDLPQWVRPHHIRYILRRRAHRPRWMIRSALWLYWLLGSCGRDRPRHERAFDEMAFLDADIADSFTFEESQVSPSDAAFVLNWILSCSHRHSQAINYCAVADGHYDSGQRLWRIDLQDTLGSEQLTIHARWVVNAAGVWTDDINRQFGIHTPCKHALSKGVSLCIRRPEEHQDTLVFDSEPGDEGMSLVPWGPVSLWGSTETPVQSIEDGFRAQETDVAYLLESLNRQLAVPVGQRDVISVRCGIRPLAVPQSYAGGNPLALSRRGRVCTDAPRQWISLFGGKITGCINMAGEVGRTLARALPRSDAMETPLAQHTPVEAPMERFAALSEPVPSARWCRDRAQCWKLEDYLRRRTNIAQWVPRGGLGLKGEFLPDVLRIATILNGGDEIMAQCEVDAYEQRMRSQAF